MMNLVLGPAGYELQKDNKRFFVAVFNFSALSLDLRPLDL